MTSRLSHNLRHLTIVRLGRWFLRLIIALGAWEYYWLHRRQPRARVWSPSPSATPDYYNFHRSSQGYRPNYQPNLPSFQPATPRPVVAKRQSTRPSLAAYLARGLAGIAYALSQLLLWPARQIFKLSRLLGRGVAQTGRGLVNILGLILLWPFKQLAKLLWLLCQALWKLPTALYCFVKKGIAALWHKPQQAFEQARRYHWQPRLNFWKPTLSFAVLALLLILPFKLYDHYQFFNQLKGQLIAVSQAAVGDLFSAKSAVDNKDFEQARHNLGQASADFRQAQDQLSVVNDTLLKLAQFTPSQTLQLAGYSKHLAKCGELASQAGANLAAAIDSLVVNTKGRKFSDVLADFTSYGHQALTKINELNSEVAQIDPEALPEDYQDEFITLENQGQFLQSSLTELLDIADNLQIFLGQNYDRRYLLVFQNNTEMRASGGFMGSFATVDFSQGQIKNLQTPKGGTYDTEAGLRVLVAAPEPLQLVNPLWHFWDCNWWPDWPQSARKIMWFYEKSDGPTVDGVISLTPTVIERLLEIIGPIDMTADYGLVIDSKNFLSVVQELSEQKPDETKEPKKIIGDLLPKIIERISHNQNREQMLDIISMLDRSLQEKQLLLYFTDEQLENKVKELGWAGQIKESDYDYLQVVNTNIAGQKSDRDMEQRLYLETTIRPDGTIVNDLTIERQHRSIKGEKFAGFRNVDWLRVYVPAGSQLIAASGFRQPDASYFEGPDPSWEQDPDLANERDKAVADQATGTKIYQEQGKTVFANWSMVDPGETAIIKLSYKLPFRLLPKPEPEKILDKLKYLFSPDELYDYTLLVQKQPGAVHTSFYYNLDIQQDLETVWHFPQTPDQRLDADQYWAYLLAKPQVD